MTEIKRSNITNASGNKVFEYASNYLIWPEFFDGVSDVKPITETIHSNGAKGTYRTLLKDTIMMSLLVTAGGDSKHNGWITKFVEDTKSITWD